MAVKERSPARPTLYAGFTNGLIAYFATAAEYRHGGYEADYSCRGHGNPSHVAPDCERILVETGVRAAEELFPDADPWDGDRGWTATGELPGPLPPDPLVHPDQRVTRYSRPISSRLASTARCAESGCRITGIPQACGMQVGHRVARVELPAALGVVLAAGEVAEEAVRVAEHEGVGEGRAGADLEPRLEEDLHVHAR